MKRLGTGGRLARSRRVNSKVCSLRYNSSSSLITNLNKEKIVQKKQDKAKKLEVEALDYMNSADYAAESEISPKKNRERMEVQFRYELDLLARKNLEEEEIPENAEYLFEDVDERDEVVEHLNYVRSDEKVAVLRKPPVGVQMEQEEAIWNAWQNDELDDEYPDVLRNLWIVKKWNQRLVPEQFKTYRAMDKAKKKQERLEEQRKKGHTKQWPERDYIGHTDLQRIPLNLNDPGYTPEEKEWLEEMWRLNTIRLGNNQGMSLNQKRAIIRSFTQFLNAHQTERWPAYSFEEDDKEVDEGEDFEDQTYLPDTPANEADKPDEADEEDDELRLSAPNNRERRGDRDRNRGGDRNRGREADRGEDNQVID